MDSQISYRLHIVGGGDYGNAFFYMVSGYTLYLAYSERIHKLNFKEFLKKRITKVYALYLISDVAQMIFEIITRGIKVINIRDIILNLTMTTSGWVENIYPYNIAAWFFSTLLIDYILFYFALSLGKENHGLVFIAMIICGMIIQKININAPFLYYHNGEAYVPFFIGCLLSKIQKDQKNQVRVMIPLLGLALCLIVLTALSGFDNAAGTWKYAWYFVVCPLLILITVNVKIVSKMLSLKPLMIILGNISTYVFFWHGPFMNYFVYFKIKGMLHLSTDGFILFYIPALILFCHTYRILEQTIKKKMISA